MVFTLDEKKDVYINSGFSDGEVESVSINGKTTISSINCWDYPGETYSSNLLLKENKIIITPSSYNLRVAKEINL